MKRTIFLSLVLIELAWAGLGTSGLAGVTGRIEGTVVDGESGEPLPAANVLIVGTSMGGASDRHGKYSIPGVPAGEYVIRCQYIGYEPQEVRVRVSANQTLLQNFRLRYVGISGDMVVVTAQAEGQMKAINQQLASPAIINVVSSARIQELPDANAAESIGRLPGVSVTRVGGEGNKIVVRGMAPKYNVVKIEGVRMGTSDPNDRSIDLSMISSDMLEGIEVAKTVTADQDADVIGGSVNFKLREAVAGKQGVGFRLTSQGGYTGLPDAQNPYHNYKLVAGLESRLFHEKFGILLQGILEQRNLSSNEFGAQYTNQSGDQINYITQAIDLNYVFRERGRQNGALVLDYRLPHGKIGLTNFISSSLTRIQNRYEQLQLGGANQHIFGIAGSESRLRVITNVLTFEDQLPLGYANVKVAHTLAETKNPNDWNVTFRHSAAGLAKFATAENLNPRSVIQTIESDPSRTTLHTISSDENHAREQAWMGAVDFQFPLNVWNKLSSTIKFGGKWRRQKRSYDSEVYGTNATFASPSARGAGMMVVKHFDLPVSDPTRIPLTFFMDTTFTYGNFMDGEYQLHEPLNFDMLADLVQFSREQVEAFRRQGSAEAFARNNYLSTTNDYSGTETMTAAYIMATIRAGTKLTFIPGIRYQRLKTAYRGYRGQQTALSYFRYNATDTVVTIIHPYWLPSVNLRYKPYPWFDVRLSYSHTLSYPDYSAIIPRIDVSTGAALVWNNYRLKPSRSRNFDIYLTFSGNKLGLFTAGWFLKRIDNLIYPWRFSKAGLEAKPYYLPDKDPAAHLTYSITTFVNNPFVVSNWGLEFDWQTHFWYLPNPLKGLVLNVNYTYAHSKAEYPFVYAGATSETDIDTSFTDRLLFQPNHIVNFSLGYDYKGFSIRFSYLLQDDVFAGVSQWPQLRTTTAAYSRWDLSMKQDLPWSRMQLFVDFNNLNGERDTTVLQMYPQTPRSIEMYGMSANFGLRWRL